MTLLQVILPVSDGPDPPSDLASSVPALSLLTLDGPALSDPTPDGSPPFPAQLQCDVDPDPAPTLDATASPAPQESVVAETVERLSAVAQQKGLAFDVSILPQFVQDASVCIQLTFFFLFFFFFSNRLFSEPLLCKWFHLDTHTNMGLNWGSTSYK